MAQLALSGVVLDGTVGTSVPTRQDFRFAQGEDTTWTLTVTGQNGTAINITGYSGALRISVAQAPITVAPLAVLPLVLTAPTSGQGTFTMTSGQSKGFSTGLLWYDVFITSGGGLRYEVVPLSLVTLNFAPGM